MENIVLVNWSTKSYSTFVAIIFSFMIFLSSCSKTPEHANYIPKDANMVVTVDVKSLGIKSLDFKELFSLSTIKKALSSAKSKDSTVTKLKASGVDLLNTAYVFANITPEETGYGALVVAISDQNKFITFVQDLGKNYMIVKEGDYTIATTDKDRNAAVIWNDNTAIFVYQSAKETAPIKDRALSILNLKKEESLAQNDKNFSELLKESSDITLWLNFEKLASLAKKYNPSTPSIDLKDTYFTAGCNFENGQIVINTKYHANKEVSEKLNLSKDKLSPELVNSIPAKSIIGMIGLALDMTKVYNYLDKEKLLSNVEGQANQTTGMSTKELLQIFSGEIVATLNGIKMQEVKSYDFATGEEILKKEPKPEFSLVLGISDKEKSSKLLSALVEKGFLTKQENSYSILNLYSIVDKGTHLILVPESMKAVALENTKEKLRPELASLLTENPAAFYLGLNEIPQESLESFGPTVSEWVKKSPMEFITLTSAPLKDQISTGKFLISFKEKNQNSLITLAKMSDELAAQSETKQQMETLPTDTTTTIIESTPEEIDDSIEN